MPRLYVLVWLTSVASLTACPLANAEPPADSRPNIVLMMADDLGWGDTGYNGHPVLKTPHLDAMAADGLRMDRFYAAAPVCSPTRGSCLTGRHPFRYGIFFANVGHIPGDELTLAELLAASGYRTGHFGKWHLGTLTKTVKDANRGGPSGVEHFAPPEDHGFQVNFSTESKVPTWDPVLRPYTAKGKNWWNPVADAAKASAYGTHYWSQGKMVTENLRGDDSRVIMDRAIPFVASAAKAGEPFFAVIWFHAPHLPVVAGPEYTALYPNESEYAQHYYGCITALDEQVGRLRKELAALGVAENTLITFCSDNGPEGSAGKAPGTAGPFRGRKRSLYEGGVRVPGLAVWPAKIKPGGQSSVPCSTSDYLPTIAELVRAERDDKRPLDGVSLTPLFAGEMKERPEPIGFESAGQASLVDNRFKLISSGRPNRRRDVDLTDFELYDLVVDPRESKDIAAEHPDTVAQMAKTLKAWRSSCKQSLAGDDYASQEKTE